MCGGNSEPRLTSAAFLDRHQPIDGKSFEHIGSSAGPLDFDAIHLDSLAQAEMQAPAVVALVAASAMDLVHQRQVAADDLHFRPDAVPVRLGAYEADLQPVSRRRIVAQEGRLARRVE